MTKQHNPILFSYSFNIDGKATKLDSQKVAEELKNQGLSWVHLDAAHKSTKKWLEKEVNYLDHLVIDALLEEETRPRIMEFDSGILVILRGHKLSTKLTILKTWLQSVYGLTLSASSASAVAI